MEEASGIPRMLGSLDCMRWIWKNCLVVWQGQFTHGDQGVLPSCLKRLLHKICGYDMLFFGVARLNNDINVLNQSTLFTNVLQGRAPPVEFTVQGRKYNMCYYLVDGIYPKWAVFVKTIPLPQSDKDKLSA